MNSQMTVEEIINGTLVLCFLAVVLALCVFMVIDGIRIQREVRALRKDREAFESQITARKKDREAMETTRRIPWQFP